jgi:hypothetical protein
MDCCQDVAQLALPVLVDLELVEPLVLQERQAHLVLQLLQQLQRSLLVLLHGMP